MKRNRKELYLCVGENFRNNCSIGYCGDTKTIMDWCKLLTHRDEDELNIFFDDSYTNKDVADYIFNSYGKRLVKAGRSA